MRRTYAVGLAALLTAVFMTGCGGDSAKSMAMDKSIEGEAVQDGTAMDNIYYDEATGATTNAATGEQGQSTELVDTNRKLIKNVNLNVETEEYDKLLASVTRRITELGGYIETSDMGKNGGYDAYEDCRYANITARIPKKQLDSFVDEVAQESNVTSKSENTEDVTLQYVDVESHKKALETEQDRLLELLEKAESMEDIITIENRLSEIRYEIETYTSQLRTFDNQVDYGTVYLYITEVQRLTPVHEQTAGERISEGFSDNVTAIFKGIQNLGIELVIFIPYLILLAVAVILVILLYKKINKISAARYAKHLAEKEALKKKAEETNGEQKQL